MVTTNNEYGLTFNTWKTIGKLGVRIRFFDLGKVTPPLSQ